MALSVLFTGLLMKLCIALVLVVINSLVLHYIVLRMKLEDESFDNPTSIAVVVSVLLLIVSYLPQFKLPFFIITNSLIPLALIKEFYNIEWIKALKIWCIWAAAMILGAGFVALLIILLF